MPYFGVPIRNGVPIGLGSVAGFGLAPFDPAQLFANAEPGAWYQSNDLTTLFQDAAGTTPVTTIQQPVGLMLDKSRGTVGSNGAKRINSISYTEDITNPAWLVNAVTIAVPTKVSASEISFPAVTAAGDVSVLQQVFTSVAAAYIGSVELKAKAAGDVGKKIGVYINDGSIVNFTYHTLTADWVRVSVTETTSATASCVFNIGVLGSTYGGQNQGACSVNIRKADVRLVSETATAPTPYQPITSSWPATFAGAHAAQTVDAARPTYSARYNQLLKSDQFNDAVSEWVRNPGVNVVNNVLQATTTGTYRSTRQNIGAVSAGARLTLTCRAKAGTSNWLFLSVTDFATVSAGLYFNLATGAKGSTDFVGANITLEDSFITPASDGFYDCTILVAIAAGYASMFAAIQVTDANASVTATAGANILLSRADFRYTNDALRMPSYQRVNTATDYDTEGFLPYLRIDGSNDALVSSAIDFSSTNAMSVWAGVRKMSDAARATVVELTASAAANNGAFQLTAPNAASATYAFESKGTTLTDAVASTGVAAPITSVLTGLASISTPSNVLLVNGAQADSDTGSQGTGNYANAALYIGARGGSSQFFNGRLYTLIVRGAASTTSEIADTNAWVNNLTAAY